MKWIYKQLTTSFPINASVNSKRQHPPGIPPGNFLRLSKVLSKGKILLQKSRPLGLKVPISGECFRRFSKPCLLITSKIWSSTEIKPYSRLGCFSNYSLVIPSNLSESNIFYLFTVLPSSAHPPSPPPPPVFLAEFTSSRLLRSPFTCTHFLLFFVRTLSCRRHNMQWPRVIS